MENALAYPVDIYVIVNHKNGKYYVGQTKRGYIKRFKEHLTDYDECPALKKAIRKYGAKNFHAELLDIAYGKKDADIKERLWISALHSNCHKYGYNLTNGGGTYSFTDSVIQKMKINRLGEGNNFFGKRHTTESRKKMSEWKKAHYIGSNHPGAKKVKCVETGKIYACIVDAEKETGANRHHISQVCKHSDGRKTAGGYHWEYE